MRKLRHRTIHPSGHLPRRLNSDSTKGHKARGPGTSPHETPPVNESQDTNDLTSTDSRLPGGHQSPTSGMWEEMQKLCHLVLLFQHPAQNIPPNLILQILPSWMEPKRTPSLFLFLFCPFPQT